MLQYIDNRIIYFPVSGKLYWNKGIYIGKELVGRSKTGYGVAKIKERILKQHHIAWYLFYGKWPSVQIDHINRIRDDNSIINLREIQHIHNTWNSKAKHIIVRKSRIKKYRVMIQREGKTYFGDYASLEEAERARQDILSNFKIAMRDLT